MLLRPIVLLVLFVCTLTTADEGEPCPLLMATGASEEDKTGCFIVNLRDDISGDSFQSTLRKVAQLSDDQRIITSGQGVANFVAVRVSDYSLEAVSECCVSELSFIN